MIELVRSVCCKSGCKHEYILMSICTHFTLMHNFQDFKNNFHILLYFVHIFFHKHCKLQVVSWLTHRYSEIPNKLPGRKFLGSKGNKGNYFMFPFKFTKGEHSLWNFPLFYMRCSIEDAVVPVGLWNHQAVCRGTHS